MYYIIYLIILYGAIKEATTHKINKVLFKISYLWLFLMAIFRYGQGQDYFNYEGIYHQVSVFTSQSFFGIFLLNDFGYSLLNYIAISLNVPYELFMAIITSITMAMFYSFLKNNCHCSMVGLLVFVSVIYMIYPLSISRQGLTIAFFFCYMYPLLKRNMIKKYIFLTIIISTIHASALIFILFPFVYKYQISQNKIVILFILTLIILLMSKNLMAYIPIQFIQDRMTTYLSDASDNQILAKIVRFLLVFPLIILPMHFLKDFNFRNNYKLFLFGFFIYALISFSELASSRLWGYFLGFECIILANLSLSKIYSKTKVTIVLFYILLSVVLWIKDINGAIEQGKYINCTILNYPYISIFEGDETVNYYRTYKGHAFVDTE